MQRKTNTFLAVLGLIVTCILVSGFVGVESASAHTASITTNNSISFDASPSGDGVSIDEESIGITSTCNKGYDLTIATSTSANLYLNGDSTKTAAYTAVDGTSALNSANNTNKWGYTITNNATSSTVFSPLSTTASSIRTISQTNNITNETIPIYYGAKTDNTIDPGSYSMGNNGTITYYLTMNPLCNIVDVAYDGNNADAGTMGAVGTGVIHTGVKDGDTVDLIASNFSRNGYGFAGWSTDPNAGTKLLDNDNTNNPVVYGPQESVTLPEGFIDNDTDNDGIVKLYAVWLQSQGNLQGWMGCANLDTTTYDSTTGQLDLTKNSVTALTDQRDNETYAIAKLADGKCWMIENLRLESTNSDNSTGALAQGYGTSATYGNFSGLADPEAPWANNSTTANSLYSTDGSNNTVSIGSGSDPGYRFPRYNNYNNQSTSANRPNNPTTNSATNSTTNAGMYSYGNYYTWHAAIADLNHNSTNNQSTTNTSLCPAGWHLPKGGNKSNEANNEFWSLIVTSINNGTNPANYESSTYPYYTGTPEGSDASNSIRAYPNNFVYSGYVYSGSVNYRGSRGYYWSSTANSSVSAYYLSLYSSFVYPGTGSNSKYGGWTIRCVASDPQIYTLSYNANGGNGAPSSQSTTANGSVAFTVSSTTPTRSGYTFAGWIDEKGNEVQAGGTFKAKDTNAVLYAIWTNNSCNPTATTIGTGNTTTDAVCLQDVTPSMKSSLPTADSATGTYSLIDARDGQSYTVAKLADGELWLTKNLNYGSGSDMALTPYDTDLTSGTIFVLPAADTTSYTATTNLAKVRLTNNSGTSDNGVYYSWAAAVTNTNSISTSPTTSICPKNWDLPTSAQYTNLKNSASYSSSNLTTAAPSTFLATGGFTNGADFYGATSYGHYWTSASTSSTVAYYARLTTSDIIVGSSTGTNTTAGGNKYYRKNIRCVASNGRATINYDGNGTAEYPVTGTTASQTNVEINSTNTSANGFTRTGWAFNGWNTEANGTGTAITAANASTTSLSSLGLAPGSTITLYAQWMPQYTITYTNNCKSWATSDTNCTDSASNTTSEQKINLVNNPSTGTETGTLGAYNKFTMTGWKIKEWTTNADGSGTTYPVSSTYTVPAGSSVGDGIILYAHWVPIYTVQYDGNGSDNDATGMGSTDATSGIKAVNHTNVAEGDTFDLFASNFKKAGYGFVGWSTDQNAWTKLTDNDSTNDAKIWGPNEVITAPAYNGTPITTLYAVWAPAETSGGNPVYLQGWNGCSAMTATTYDSTTGTLTVAKDSVTALTDERDGNVYAIAKLADENCWMIENLRLADTHEEGGNTVATTLTTSNTNIDTNNNTLPITNIYNADPLQATTSNSLSPSSSVAYNASSAPYGWCTTNSAACDDQSRLNTTNTVTNTTPSMTQSITSVKAHSDFDTTVYAYGNYYNWYSANAGYGTYDKSTGNTDGDFCPAGWKLPYGNTGTSGSNIGNTKGGFYYLADQMSATSSQASSNKLRMFPNNFIYSGYWEGRSASVRGNTGLYWSATAYGNNYAFPLGLRNNYNSPGYGYSNKYIGASVRCVSGS